MSEQREALAEQKTEFDQIELGSLWRRNPPGREVVRVRRVWIAGDEVLVRAHPTHGGRPLVASTTHLREHYTEVVTSPVQDDDQ